MLKGGGVTDYLKIQDNGRGFDPDDKLHSARHGLSVMQERANLLNATLQITSSPDEGTTALLTIPYQTNFMG